MGKAELLQDMSRNAFLEWAVALFADNRKIQTGKPKDYTEDKMKEKEI